MIAPALFPKTAREGRGGQLEGWYGVLLLAPDAKRGATRYEHGEIRARLDQPGHLGRRTKTPAFQVPEKCRRGVDGLQPHRRTHWEPEQEVGCGRKSEGGRARTTRGKRRASGQ
jgi:hypothetical protein